MLGGLWLRFTGPCRFQPKKNCWHSTLPKWRLARAIAPVAAHPAGSLSGSIAARAIAKLPFFSFFQATPQFLAARGRGGGLAIWVKRPDG
jgi:hypothetical protein